MKFHFEFISNYDGVSDYRVYQLGTRINFRISLKNSTKQIKVEYCRLKNYEIDFEFTPVTI